MLERSRWPSRKRSRSVSSTRTRTRRTSGVWAGACGGAPGSARFPLGEVLPEFREYERFATTALNAYLSPLAVGYLVAARRSNSRGPAAPPRAVGVPGGLVTPSRCRRAAAAFVLSGPAGGRGRRGSRRSARRLRDVLTFDMGGTSTDVALVVAGGWRPRPSPSSRASDQAPGGRRPLGSAAGGSIAWVDAGGALQGRASLGRAPGPALRPRRGEEPTVTDANLVLGYLAGGATTRRRAPLDARRARGARTPRRALGMDALEAAARAFASRTRRWCGRCGWSASSAAWIRASSRSSPSAAPGPARLRARRGARRDDDPRPEGGRCPLRARARVSDLRRDYVRHVLAPVARRMGCREAFAELEAARGAGIGGRSSRAMPTFATAASLRADRRRGRRPRRARGRLPRGPRAPLRLPMEGEPVEIVPPRRRARAGAAAGARRARRPDRVAGGACAGLSSGGEAVETAVYDPDEPSAPARRSRARRSSSSRRRPASSGPGGAGAVEEHGTLVLERL